jgi:hypothetical protein
MPRFLAQGFGRAGLMGVRRAEGAQIFHVVSA